MATSPAHAQFSEVESYMCQKGQEYRTIDKTRAGRIYERLKAHITPPKRTIQILGTNGKGSTGRFLALMLMQNGAKVLHFTSPHIFSFNERFYCNGAVVGDSELTKAHRFLQRFDFISECSYFEYATFLALVLAQGVDYLILEAGVGGELDSTSVIPREMCVFSVVDYDHTEILGESIEAIATTKLNAVFYPNRVKKMVLGAQKYEVVEKIAKEIAKAHSVEFYTLDSATRAKNAESTLDSANSQNLGENNPRVSANLESRPLRGAKNRIQGCRSATADFLLEADKRGSPPKSEKRSFWRVGGAGRGVQPFLREKTSEIDGERFAESIKESQSGLPRFAKGKSRNDEFLDSSHPILPQNDNLWLDSAKSQNLQGGLPRRFCESARNDEFLDSSLRKCSAQNDKIKSYFTKHNLAPFLVQNLALALKALEVLGQSCDLNSLPPLDLRGRFEAIAPNIIIDVGHNQNAAFAIKQNLGQKKVILVYNSYFQKNISEILETLKGNIKSVQILRIHGNPRIIKQEILEQILGNLNISYKNFDGAKSLDKDENYLVFGSFSVVEAFMRDYSGENRK